MNIKLTETHLKLLVPILEQKKKIDDALASALILIAGVPFNKWEIKDGELIVEELKEESK